MYVSHFNKTFIYACCKGRDLLVNRINGTCVVIYTKMLSVVIKLPNCILKTNRKCKKDTKNTFRDLHKTDAIWLNNECMLYQCYSGGK
jgi:hypothetical protein